MAYLVEQNSRSAFAATKLWDQMMVALFRFGRDRAPAQRADGIAHKDQSTNGPAGTMPKGLRNSDGEK